MEKPKAAGYCRWQFAVACLFALLDYCSPGAFAESKNGALSDVQADELAPGWTELKFKPPTPGTYQLPPLGEAGDGHVIDSNGVATSLHRLMGGMVVVISFIYSSCSDVNGCPLATHVLGQLQQQLLQHSHQERGTAGNVRLISLSFDPRHDTPEVMQQYRAAYISADFDWRFLTTRAEQDLQPILQSYGQSIIRDKGAEEDDTGNISHLLKVFLVDRNRRIRNVYSASYLHAKTMLSDILTLELESASTPPNERQALQGAGDYKEGYADPSYQTKARSLRLRSGKTADRQLSLKKPPLGLPPIPVPKDNPASAEKIELGRLLFFDRRLSHNNTLSCAMCHVPEQGFTSNELTTAVGIEGRTVRRNAATIYNVAFLERLFHDGRESSLEQQIWGPLLAVNEMGNPSVGQVIDKVKAIPAYQKMFRRAFDRPPSMETLGMALASYQWVLVSANSPFDRWYYGGQKAALSEEQQAGFRLFTGKAACSACHQVQPNWALFTDQQLHNTGVGYQRSMLKAPAAITVQIAPGEEVDVRGDVIAAASETPPSDLGRYEITLNRMALT